MTLGSERHVIAVRVTPRSSKPGIGAWRAGPDGRAELEVRVSAAPTDGNANAALIRLLAKELGIARTAVEILAGETSRHKRISLPIDEAELRARLKR